MIINTASDVKVVLGSFRAKHPEVPEDTVSEVYRRAVRLLENLIHYRKGSHTLEDLVTVMEGLVKS